jgi:hypothetical protein
MTDATDAPELDPEILAIRSERSSTTLAVSPMSRRASATMPGGE